MKIKSTSNIKKLSVGKIIARVSILFGIFLLSVLILCFTAMGIVFKGPSQTAKDLVVNTFMETSFLSLFPPMYLSDNEIKDIKERNSVVITNDVTDGDIEFEKPDETQKPQPDIEVIDVSGPTYKGKMMIVKDPSRLCVATPDVFGKDLEGVRLDKLIEKENGIAGVNGGGFLDENGVGKGGMPLGIVMQKGNLTAGDLGTSSVVIGFDDKNVLHVGKMTGKEALEKNIKEAVSFGPPLIINSNPAQAIGSGGGLNPRTAIGQRADGSVLLLVIDGRQPHSLGASYKDLIDVMLKFGAINAGNLDGGSSTALYHNGQILNTSASLYGPRKIPTAFVVKKQ